MFRPKQAFRLTSMFNLQLGGHKLTHNPSAMKTKARDNKKGCALRHYFFGFNIISMDVLHHINGMSTFTSPHMAKDNMEKGLERVHTTASVENIPTALE